MERPYEIEDCRTMQRLETSLKNRQDPVQLLLSAIEITAARRNGGGDLIRRAGLEPIGLLMEQEVEEVVGKRHRQSANGKAYRWGKDQGWCRTDRQKVSLKWSRAREVGGSELRLGSYFRFQHDPRFYPKLWHEVVRGLSTLNYASTVRRFAEAYGIEESAVSEQFVEAGPREQRELIERSLNSSNCVR